MKRFLSMIMATVSLLLLCSCGTPDQPQQVPQISQMKNICELATMECYYHNVAKFKEEDAGGFFWNKKDKHFWIEYSGQVTVGIDVSRMDIQVDGTDITITLPPAEIQGCHVDKATLTEESFIIAENSIAPSAEDQTMAFKAANQKMLDSAAQNTAILNMAQEQAEALIQNYINCIGEKTGTEYQVTWAYLEPDAPSASVTASTEETVS